jgi:hypothetical protein
MDALVAVALLWLAPSTERIDYAHPQRYLAQPPAVGSPQAVRAVAAQIRGATDEARLRAISRFIATRLRVRAETPNTWRTLEQILADGTLASCADTAVVFGTLARALGVPTVWVETMDVDWIRAFKRDPDHPGTWSGHVFLEAFADGRWRLVDASTGRIYDDYDPRQRLLPGNRWAYDKGDDPSTLLMSLHGQPWRDKTRAHFLAFDARQLPVGAGRPLVRSLFVVADGPIYQWVLDRGEKLGVRGGHSGNAQFESWLPAAAGHWLVLTVVGKRFVLASEHRDRYSPLSALQVEAALQKQPSGRADRTLDDGTRVVLFYARDEAALRGEIERLTLDE